MHTEAKQHICLKGSHKVSLKKQKPNSNKVAGEELKIYERESQIFGFN